MLTASRRRKALVTFAAFCLVTAALLLATRMGLLDAYFGKGPRLSAGDFPAGVSAPGGSVASVPLRPTRLGFTPRGSSSALLIATGGAVPSDVAPPAPSGKGLLKSAYALDAVGVAFSREEDLRKALSLGVDRGGVDLAAVSVDRLAAWASRLRDAAPRTVLLLGRSQGQEALAAVGAPDLPSLRGKRLAVDPQGSAYYFALWLLSRAALSITDVQWVDLPSTLEAGPALREGRAEAVVGYKGDAESAAKDRGGTLVATSADAPHLLATVLVVRGDFAARYPDAVRRVVRGLLDAASAVQREPAAGARALGEVAPYLGDPLEAISSDPPSGLTENLAFFGLAGEAPVTYRELWESAANLWSRIGVMREAGPLPSETTDLGVLRSISEPRH